MALIRVDYEDLPVPIHCRRDDISKDASVYEFLAWTGGICRRVSIPFSQEMIRFKLGMLWTPLKLPILSVS
jgi:hypothetical protein